MVTSQLGQTSKQCTKMLANCLKSGQPQMFAGVNPPVIVSTYPYPSVCILLEYTDPKRTHDPLLRSDHVDGLTAGSNGRISPGQVLLEIIRVWLRFSWQASGFTREVPSVLKLRPSHAKEHDTSTARNNIRYRAKANPMIFASLTMSIPHSDLLPSQSTVEPQAPMGMPSTVSLALV